MKNKSLTWMFNQISENNFLTQIINIKTYQTIYAANLNQKNLKTFKKIMESNKFSIQYIQNSNNKLREAAQIKLKISPLKPIPFINDPKLWQNPNYS